MTRMQWKDFFVEIRRSLPRYLSIFFIVALGVAFFAGVRASEPDMRLSADAYYDDTNFLDIRVLSTLGLSEDDLDAIRQIEGVSDAYGLYSVDAFVETEEESLVATIQSLTGDVSRYYLSEGRLPETDSECLLDEAFLMYGDYEIGDTITLQGGGGEDLSDTLVREEYTIVGFGLSPMFLSWERGSASIGNGDVTGFVALTPEAFTTDTYTQIYVTTDQADELMSMTDEYDSVVDEVQDAIEAISEERCEIRYHELTDEPYEELAQSKQDVEDGWQELEDARQELVDAEAELLDAQDQITEGESQLIDGEAQIRANEQLLIDSQADVDAGWEDYTYIYSEYDANAQKIADAEKQLTDGKITYQLNEQNLADAKAQLETAKQQIAEGEANYQSALTRVESVGSAEAGDTVYGRTLLQGYADRLLNDTTSLLSWQIYIEELYTAGQISEATYTQLSSMTPEDVASLMIAYATVTTYEESLAAIEPLEQQIAEGETALADAKAQLDEAERQLEEGKAQLEEGNRELISASVQLEVAQQQIDSGYEELNDAKAELEQSRAELEQSKQDLEDGWREYYEQKAEQSRKSPTVKKNCGRLRRISPMQNMS